MVDDVTRRGHLLDRSRRFFLTVFLYFVFGAGALVISCLVILPVVVVSRDRECRVRRVRWVNRLAFNTFIGSGVTLGVFDVSFVDDWRLNKPGQLIIANHPSLLDVVFLLGRIPNANCVVKKKLLKNPFLAIHVYFADYIFNDDGEALLQNCIVSLEKGDTVIIFPEGTRTVRNQTLNFKRGAAYLMLMSNCPVRPVYISCKPFALSKKDPWYVVPERKITYCLTVMAELDMAAIRQTEKIRLPFKSRRLTKWLVDWYETMDLRGPCRSFEKITIPPILLKKSVG